MASDRGGPQADPRIAWHDLAGSGDASSAPSTRHAIPIALPIAKLRNRIQESAVRVGPRSPLRVSLLHDDEPFAPVAEEEREVLA